MDSDAGLKEVYICTKSIKHFHIFNLYIYIYITGCPVTWKTWKCREILKWAQKVREKPMESIELQSKYLKLLIAFQAANNTRILF